MNDQTINRKLALAIGWKPKQINSFVNAVFVRYCDCWARFDFRHWHTIGPIAQRYDCFPFKINPEDAEWSAYVRPSSALKYADTPQKAIALAVIAAHEAGVLR